MSPDDKARIEREQSELLTRIPTDQHRGKTLTLFGLTYMTVSESDSQMILRHRIEAATHERELMEKELAEKDKKIEELEIELQRMADECLDNDDPIHSDNDEVSV